MVATKKIKLRRWRIVNRFKDGRFGKKWERETFQTGGGTFFDFRKAQDIKKKLNKMSSSIEYKVINA